MFELSEIFAYALVVLALQVVPGPAVLLTLARSIAGGVRVGIATGAGIAVGDMLHTVMAVLGLSAILMTSALAFEVVKYCGVAYLIWLGVQAFRETPADLKLPSAKPIAARAAFKQAILAETLNPKTALFFLSFLPLFVHPERGAVAAQLLVLGLVFVVLSICVTCSFAYGAAFIAERLKRRPAIARWQGRVVGSIYFGLGLHLALQERR
jgi:threonine/homoserine/homoserine lactone efflux protein